MIPVFIIQKTLPNRIHQPESVVLPHLGENAPFIGRDQTGTGVENAAQLLWRSEGPSIVGVIHADDTSCQPPTLQMFLEFVLGAFRPKNLDPCVEYWT